MFSKPITIHFHEAISEVARGDTNHGGTLFSKPITIHFHEAISEVVRGDTNHGGIDM